MEEKERYELFGEHCIKDNDVNARCQLLDAYKACVILNEQNELIKSTREQNERVKEKLGTITNYNQDLERENQQLKQELAEYKEMFYATQELKEDCELKILELEKQCAKLKQSQNQKAIEELGKVKESAYQSATDISCLLDYTELVKIIDNQIKELKGEE